jgi:hypothetical protein
MNHEVERRIERLIEEGLWQSIKDNPAKSVAAGGAMGLLGHRIGSGKIKGDIDYLKNTPLKDMGNDISDSIKSGTDKILNTTAGEAVDSLSKHASDAFNSITGG